MTTVRTVFRPWEDLDVTDTEAAALAAQGLLAPVPTAAEEVTPGGSSEEGRGESDEGDGLRGGEETGRETGGDQPRPGRGDPGGRHAEGEPGSEESQPEPEEGSPSEEEGLTA